jgi:hypothetical protein
VINRALEIRAAVSEILSLGKDDPDLCATLEIPSNTNHWVQVTREEVNLAYPFEDDPVARLASARLAGFELLDWQPKLYATFRHGRRGVDIVAGFVAAYFTDILGETGDDLSVTMDDLHG